MPYIPIAEARGFTAISVIYWVKWHVFLKLSFKLFSFTNLPRMALMNADKPSAFVVKLIRRYLLYQGCKLLGERQYNQGT